MVGEAKQRLERSYRPSSARRRERMEEVHNIGECDCDQCELQRLDEQLWRRAWQLTCSCTRYDMDEEYQTLSQQYETLASKMEGEK